jgi:hypothetical protein
MQSKIVEKFPQYVITISKTYIITLNLTIYKIFIKHHFLFYVSWIVIRNMLGPWISYHSIQLTRKRYATIDSYDLFMAYTLILITILLNILNIKWTYDLFSKLLKYPDHTSKGLWILLNKFYYRYCNYCLFLIVIYYIMFFYLFCYIIINKEVVSDNNNIYLAKM